MKPEVQEWLDAQEEEFMRPAVDYLTEQEAQEYTDDPEARPGYYSRLSAPGYMDCTDWQGPYHTPEEALEGLYETFAD